VFHGARATRKDSYEPITSPPVTPSIGKLHPSSPGLWSDATKLASLVQPATKLTQVQRELAEVTSRLATVAAITIQQQWREVLARRAAPLVLASRKFLKRWQAAGSQRTSRVASVAATTIQQNWRGAIARSRFKKLLKRRMIITRRMTPSSSAPWLPVQSSPARAPRSSPGSGSRRSLRSAAIAVCALPMLEVHQEPSPLEGVHAVAQRRGIEQVLAVNEHEQLQQSGRTCIEAEQGPSGQPDSTRAGAPEEDAPISPIRLLRFG
jgi:hypothetical protein